MSTASRLLARHVIALRHDDVPRDVRDHAIRLVADAIGAGIYGAGTVPGSAIHAEASGRYATGACPVWGRASGLPPAGAALVNGAQAHAFELDDYVPAGKTHPGTVIIPAAVAIAGDATSGEELITAIVAAYDVMCRVAFALNPNSARGRGFHMTGISGPFGAAAVAGRLLGLDEDELTSAFGIAASFSAGIFAFSAEGAMTKPLHAGRAAEAGIVAAKLAREGLTGPTAALEAEDGGLLKAVSDAPRPEELTRDLGHRFDLAAAAIKPYPCCGSNHSSIDAIRQLRTEHGLVADEIESIVVHNARGVVLQCGFDYTGQGGPLEAQMSLQYCVAAAVADGAVRLEHFGARRTDADLLRLAHKVSFVVDEEIDRVYPRRFPARVTVHLADGETLAASIDAPLGTPEHPIDDAGLRRKFVDVTAPSVGPADRHRLLDAINALDTPEPAGKVTTILREIGALHRTTTDTEFEV